MSQDTFYISFQTLTCTVHADNEWRKYFRKLYSQSPILMYSDVFPSGTTHEAELAIKTAEKIDQNINFSFIDSGNHYFQIHSSSMPLFLYLSVHQCMARIFNILFHKNGGIVLHASSVLLPDGSSVVFCGKSGVGKSTTADIIEEKIHNSIILSDNSAFISNISGRFSLYPSPYLESNRIQSFFNNIPTNSSYRIRCLYWLEQAQYHEISILTFQQKVKYIQNNSHIPYQINKLFDYDLKKKFGLNVFNLIKDVPMYKLKLAKNPDFVKLISFK